MASPTVSGAFFNPQSRAPTPEYLNGLQAFLQQHPHGKTLLQHVASLGSVWPVWASVREDIRTLPNAEHYVNLLVSWAKGGPSDPVSEARTGVIALPLLLILQLGQYFRYLEHNGLSHAEFIEQAGGAGGIQGCCGGEPPALSVALAKDEAQVVENAAVFLRILVGVGGYIEAVDDWTSSEPTIIAIRLKHEGQGEELMQKFPGTYVSAITEPKSLSFVGNAKAIARLYEYARDAGLPADLMDVTGKAHNPENSHLVPEFLNVLKRNPSLFDIPKSSNLQVTVRSNIDGKKLTDDSIMEDMVIMMLAACCDWYRLLSRVAEDMKASGRPTHHMVIFGMNDSVPLSPFNKQRLRITKFKAHVLIPEVPRLADPIPNGHVENANNGLDIKFSDDAIAIVGVACRLPGASNLEELWEFISKGGDAHQEILKERIDRDSNFRASQEGSPQNKFFGNFISDIKRFDNAFFGINAKEAASLDPQQRMLLELSFEALDSSGYLSTHRRHAEDRVGCFIGGSLNEYHDNTSSHAPTAYTATGTIRAFLCGRLSYHYGWTAPSEVIDTACSSSLVAVNRACRAISSGECDMAIAGGVSALTALDNFLDLGKAGFLSPTGQCKPFDASADGYCRAEGAGLVVLKKLGDAIQAGDEIFGVIPSIATNQGGTSITLTVPSASALKSLYRSMLDRAQIDPTQVSYVEAHGTGTQAGDPIEMDSIRTVLGGVPRPVPLSIGSIKGNIGHTESAAGVAGLLKVLAMIRYGSIPPQANHNRLNPKIPPLEPHGLEITRALRRWDVPLRIALVNSYGAGGSNCALLCCEMPRSSRVSTVPADQGENIVHQIIVSAASKAALVANSRMLAGYLARQTTKIDVADVAFTLNQRRKRHRFCADVRATDIPSLVRSLNSVDAPTFESPAKTKPVVLMLSGQYDDKVALDRRFYEEYPAFRSYIDTCNSKLVELGYNPIIPTIFQKTPVDSALTLQCSIFAIQYASARCWIDSGLRPAAIIGHSLGEFAALAISGALTLEQSLELVAFRAQLVDSAWGPERGSMLAIHTGTREISRLIERVKAIANVELEVACYNAPKSIVIAGTATAIDSAERILNNEFSGTKYQRLRTTHAFHSLLTEGILPDLKKVSAELDWTEPLFPVETCTPDPLSSIQDWNPARHAREPVFFSKAIQRVEERLGSCIWFEAGLDTPVIAMTKRACADSGTHDFQVLSTRSSGSAWDLISAVVSDCWRCGLSLSHWSTSRPGVTQIWLPPYQFEKQQHWIDYVDRATEAHQKLLAAAPVQTTSTIVAPPPRLLTRKGSSTSNSRVIEFAINTQSERFQEVVKGHAVLQIPLCPAPMHMECCTMAIQSIVGEVEGQNLTFENLHFHSPLALDPNREVNLRLEELVPSQSWNFTVCSKPIGSAAEPQVHCTGIASLPQQLTLSTYGRLVESNIDRVENCESTERLMAKRAYGLFLRVMHYAPFFKGISNLAVDGTEAVATIKLPTGQPGRNESTVWKKCDTVLIDAFISVVGLLLNSSDAASDDDILIAVGIQSVTLSSACQMGSPDEYLVYAKFQISEGTNPIGDVFVCSPVDRTVVAMMTGVQFAKVDIAKFKKTLMSANGIQQQHSTQRTAQPSEAVITATPDAQAAASSGTQSAISFETKSTVPINTPAEGDIDTGVKEIISNYTGLHPDDIPRDAVLVELGIDSLSSIEFATEIHTTFGIEIQAEELGDMTLDSLTQRLGYTGSGNVSKQKSSIEKDDISEPKPAATSPVVSAPYSVNHMDSAAADYNPFEALLETDKKFQEAATRRGYIDYHAAVAPVQNNLTLAYILEAFKSLGVDVLNISSGSIVPGISFIPKHDKLVSRLWDILQEHGIISRQASVIIRGRSTPKLGSSGDLYDFFTTKFPQYLPEARLMKMMGEKLAACLNGEQDPLSLMFGTQASSKIMEEYYANSPMVSTLTDQLVTFVCTLASHRNTSTQRPLRILEVGAGTGGTTLRLVENLEAQGISCEYTFTDIAGRMVVKAKERFRKYPWMRFENLDLEKEVRDTFRNKFDLVIATNCVHATASRVASLHRLWETLNADGVVILSEGTVPLPWFDITFGLLEGWWVAENGTEYPLQPATKWMEAFKAAGFPSSSFTRGPVEEAFTQQLLIGSKTKWPVLAAEESVSPPTVDRSDSFQLETVVYKEVSGVQIHADLYIPQETTSSPLPVALMIHGGGFMMLSRKMIRPAQTKYLLSQGFLPVSVDYRLCPEVNIIDGPMADVRDAYRWVRDTLPSYLVKKGVIVDHDRVVVIGWSTGGHLAMSTGWTTRESGITPPTAILSFYAPVDFESGELDAQAKAQAPLPRTAKNRILDRLSKTPITNYETKNAEDNFFGLQPGDPRSDLLLTVSQDGTALALLLNGLHPQDGRDCFEPPNPSLVAAISPLAQARQGNYLTPTFIIHSPQDEVAPFAAAERLIDELKRQGVDCGLLRLDGASHLHDVHMRPGVLGWEEQVVPGYRFLVEAVSNALF